MVSISRRRGGRPDLAGPDGVRDPAISRGGSWSTWSAVSVSGLQPLSPGTVALLRQARLRREVTGSDRIRRATERDCRVSDSTLDDSQSGAGSGARPAAGAETGSVLPYRNRNRNRNRNRTAARSTVNGVYGFTVRSHATGVRTYAMSGVVASIFSVHIAIASNGTLSAVRRGSPLASSPVRASCSLRLRPSGERPGRAIVHVTRYPKARKGATFECNPSMRSRR